MINLLLCGNKKVFDGALTQLISITNRTNEVVARGEAAKKEREKQAQISQNSNENLPNTEKRDTINTDKGNNKINK